MKERINCVSVPKSDLPAPHSIERNGWVFISGVTGDTEQQATDSIVDFEWQASVAMTRLAKVAEQSGIEMDELLKCNIYLKDMSMRPAFDKVYATFFNSAYYPARYIFEMPSLPNAKGVVIEAIGRKAKNAKKSTSRVTLRKGDSLSCFADAVRTENFIFTSAISPATESGGKCTISFDNQIRSATERMIHAVELAGGGKKDIVKVVVFLRDLDLFDQFNTIYREYFNKENNPPARSCFGVSSFDGNYEVALECVAYIGTDRETLCSSDVPVYDLPFCQGIRAEDMVFVSGQVGCDKQLGGMPEKFEDQMHAVLRNMMSVAKEAGASADDFVRTTGYLVNPKDYDKYKQIYSAFWGDTLPTTTLLHVSGISYDYAMEIDSHVCILKE